MPSAISRSKKTSELTSLKSLVTMAMAVAILYFARDLLIPFALALLLSFLLTPPVGKLEKLHLRRIPSVLIVLVVTFSVSGAVGWLGMTQLGDIVAKTPRYQENLRRKIEALHGPAGLTQALARAQQLGGELTGPESLNALSQTGMSKTSSAAAEGQGPVAVELVTRPPGLLGSLNYVGSSLVHLLGVAAAVLIFTLFMLVQRGDLRNRFLRLVGTGHLAIMTTALDDAARGISKYLRTQLIVNAAFGALLGLGLYWIGVPNAPFWGVLGALLRFVPYVGTLIAGLCPFVLALAVFEGWAKPLLCIGLFAGIEVTMSAAIEPWLYGVHTGISSLAILVSTAFWTLLWGPVGLVLSTPLTVCLLVLGRYVPGLQFLSVALGDKVELPLEARYYQRLLALDDEESHEIAETYLKQMSLGELFDLLLIPALALAEEDRHQNALDEEREKFIYRTTKLLIEDLVEEAAPEDSVMKANSSPALVCIPARDEADELVGLMLEELLQQAGHNAKAVALGAWTDMFQVVQDQRADILVISALPPFALMPARSVCRKARRRFPQLKIVLGLWGSMMEAEKLPERTGLDCFDAIITSVREAELQLPVPANSDLSADDRVASIELRHFQSTSS